MIKIVDDQLPESVLIECIGAAEKSQNYSVMHGAGDGSYGFKYNWLFFCDKKDVEIKNKELNNLWLEAKRYLPSNVRLHRGYVNAHTYGVEDAIHADDPELTSGLTVIVYLCSSWYPEWFGQTTFFGSLDRHHHNDIVQSVVPKFNRMIIFDKDIPHCVSPLSRRFSGIRLTCMFKVELLDDPT